LIGVDVGDDYFGASDNGAGWVEDASADGRSNFLSQQEDRTDEEEGEKEKKALAGCCKLQAGSEVAEKGATRQDGRMLSERPAEYKGVMHPPSIFVLAKA